MSLFFGELSNQATEIIILFSKNIFALIGPHLSTISKTTAATTTTKTASYFSTLSLYSCDIPLTTKPSLSFIRSHCLTHTSIVTIITVETKAILIG